MLIVFVGVIVVAVGALIAGIRRSNQQPMSRSTGRLGLVAVSALGLSLLVSGEAGAAASWQTQSGMHVPRAGVATTVGSDGRVYAIGGISTATNYEATNEAFSIDSNQWSTVAPMPTGRYDLAAAAGSDGRIYAMGGFAAGNADSSANEVYTPSSNGWATAAPIPTARGALAAATGLDGRIYAIGGIRDGFGDILTKVEAYSPSSNSWSTVEPLPSPRYGLAATTGTDGRIYAIGGYDPSTADYSSRVMAFTPSTDSWATLAPLPTGRMWPAAATGADGRIYLIGGYDSASGNATSEVDVYNPSTNTWSVGPSLTVARARLAATATSSGAMFAVGGDDTSGATSPATELLVPNPGPVGSVSVNDGAPLTNSSSVSLSVPAWDPDGVTAVRISNSSATSGGLLSASNQYSYTTPISWDLSDPMTGGTAGDGAHTVYVQWQDQNGNWSDISSDSIVVDTHPPSGTVTINGGATTTPGYSVVVGVAASDDANGVSFVRLSNAPTTSGGVLSQSAVYDYQTPINWYLADPNYGGTTGSGSHTVYVQWQDAAGSWSAVSSASISVQPGVTAGQGSRMLDSYPVNGSFGSGGIGVSAADGLIYAVGTYSARNGTTGSALFKYYPKVHKINAWIRGMSGPITATHDGRLINIDGQTTNVITPPSSSTTGAPVPVLRNQFAIATGGDGRVYLFGGSFTDAGTTTYSGTVQIYDPATNQWSGGTPMPTPRAGASAVTLNDGTILVLGGRDANGLIKSAKRYNPATDKWTSAAAMPVSAPHLLALMAGDGLVYAFGTGFEQLYDPSANAWINSPIPGFPHVTDMTMVVVDPFGTIHFVGAGTDQAYSPSLPPTGGTVTINGGAMATSDLTVTVSAPAHDADYKVTNVSVNGTVLAYRSTFSWTLPGGPPGPRQISVRWRDQSGSWSDPATASIDYHQAPAPPGVPAVHFVQGAVVDTSHTPATIQGRAVFDASPTGGICQYDLSRSDDGAAFAPVSKTALSRNVQLAFSLGHTLSLEARAVDCDGFPSSWAVLPTFSVTTLQDGFGSYDTHWKKSTTVAGAYGGSVETTSTAGGTATFNITGGHVAWIGTVGPNRGQADVYVDGMLVDHVTTTASALQAAEVVFRYETTPGNHVVKIIDTTGRIDIDALIVLN